ncbi:MULTISPECIES: type VII secretion-associated protein [unclassified Mycobacterium]|uniref:type VII secretion-associated protein n=1 Tax=unclassified Mycobacterium TaxID=2642494 RepID=UPI0007FC0728|nr:MULTISPECIES: type VII secretion-associated protein [unclassified Mycobacterium]OBG57522.1 type VII secretion-associated protein [Mycobacterium sp. E188]OBH35527.1 type VII secretion-associated protein [Mycobacterium sp. E183]
MNTHRAIIEVGPGAIRRLCCRTSAVADEQTSEIIAAALSAIDDRVALVGGRPIAVASLWADALRSVACTGGKGMVVLHPSWWSSLRVGVVSRAAASVSDDVLARPRSWLLKRAGGPDADAATVVEIAERMVVVGDAAVAIRRGAQPCAVADEVIAAVAGRPAGVLLIDEPSTIAGSSTLAAAIAAVAGGNGRTVVRIGAARLARLARLAVSDLDRPAKPGDDRGRPRARTLAGIGAAGIVLAAAAPAGISADRHRPVTAPTVQAVPTTFLVEGRVAVAVPADWPTQRVVAGPGSARIQVTSPSDPEVALHVTQSPVVGETLSGTAERLQQAIDAEPAGVFVDFNPSGISAGRPAVTYREVRAAHHVRWTVLLDGPVRISLGCQSRPGGEEAVRGACEQAVRSAHAVG